MRSPPIRDRLLRETAERALRMLRQRSALGLARLRAVASAAFLSLTAVLAWQGHGEAQAQVAPLVVYAALSFAALRFARGGAQRFLRFAPLADVAFVGGLQWHALARSESPAFSAGWTLGLLVMVVAFAAFTVEARTVVATGLVAVIAQVAVQARFGGTPAGIAAGTVALALTALAVRAAVGELRELLSQVVRNQVDGDELRRAQDEAETLTHLIVHDMKGPLTGMIALAELVAAEVPPSLRSDVKLIEEQGRRLQTMVNDLLAIARLERGVLGAAPEEVDLEALLHGLAEVYGPRARQSGVRLEASVGEGLSAVLQRELIQRLFDNLLLNALDFVKPGGRIELSARQHADELVLAVKNTGEPVPPEARARLFEKHAGARRVSRNNLGLGLYFCRMVAMAHDGTIALEDESGWAAAFVVRLPVERRRLNSRLAS